VTLLGLEVEARKLASPDEVVELLAPGNVVVCHTPAELVTAIVTEAGVLRPPYASAIAALVASPANR